MTEPRVCAHESSHSGTTELHAEHVDGPSVQAMLDDAEGRIERVDELIGPARR